MGSPTDHVHRDRDALPTLPIIPWHVAESEWPDLSVHSRRKALGNANDTIRRLRALACGEVSIAGGAPGREWHEARGQQREVALTILGRWIDWRDDLEAAPSPSEALRLLGGLALGGYTSAQPTDIEAQAGGRLPKGAICPIDVERLSLPPPGTVPVQLADVSPTACAYLSKFRERMLKKDDLVDWERYRTQRTYADDVFRKKDDLLRLCERMWQSGMLGFTSESRSEVSAFGVVRSYKEPG